VKLQWNPSALLWVPLKGRRTYESPVVFQYQHLITGQQELTLSLNSDPLGEKWQATSAARNGLIYEAQGLVPFFTHGPLIAWMYPVFGIKGPTYFGGVSEWLF
jgi:hypothetical protein